MEPADKSPRATDEGAFDNFLPTAKEWGIFSGTVLVIAAIAAYAYEWGYGDAIGFDILSATSTTDRASEWRVLWPIVLTIFLGRCLVPPWGDLSAYPKWARDLQSSGVSAFGWLPLILGLFFILFMFVPAFRETHPDAGDDPIKISAYAMAFVFLMAASSPIAQVKLAFFGKIGFFIIIGIPTVLFAHFLGGEAGRVVLDRSGPVLLACLKGDGKSASTPLEIVRSFESGFLVRDASGFFHWIEKKNAKDLGIAPLSPPGSWINCNN